MDEKKFVEKWITSFKMVHIEPSVDFNHRVIEKIHTLEARKQLLKTLFPPVFVFSVSALAGIALMILSVMDLSAYNVPDKNLVSDIFRAQIVPGKFSISSLHHCWNILEDCRRQNCSCCQTVKN